MVSSIQAPSTYQQLCSSTEEIVTVDNAVNITQQSHLSLIYHGKGTVIVYMCTCVVID